MSADGFAASPPRERIQRRAAMAVEEIATGYTVNYCTDTFFPPIADAEILIAA